MALVALIPVAVHALASADDPPVLLFYDNPAAPGQPAKDPPHSGSFGADLAEK